MVEFVLPCKEGDTGRTVVEVQVRIGIPTTGWFEQTTKAAVEAWQRKFGLPVTGEVDQAMFDILTAPLPPDPPAAAPAT